MPIKESSDELNPPVVIPVRELAPPKRRRSVGDYVALAIATCGVGYSPIAPGTMGSLVGVGIYLVLWRAVLRASVELDANAIAFSRAYTELIPSFLLMWTLPLFTIGISLVGIWAASRAERLMGKKDPSQVVIDEVAGQLVTFMFVPAYFLHPLMIVVGFVLFRAFDIIKPYPIRRVEGLHGGLGIVGDDIVAGFYAGAALALVVLLAGLHLLP
jgi:phosphatidylglycerophosphatase A